MDSTAQTTLPVSSRTFTPVIVGQGAIGSLLAYYFEQASVEYRVLTRCGAPVSIEVDTGGSDGTLCSQHIHPKGIAMGQLNHQHVLFLPLKAFQVQSCVESLAPCLNGASLVLMHNGMGTSESVIQHLPQTPVAACLTSNGVFKPDGEKIRLTGHGPTQIGWLNGASSQLSQWFKHVFIHTLPLCSWTDNIRGYQWRKLVVNAVINPLTARDNVKNGALLDPHYQTEIASLCDEIASIKRACGFETKVQELISLVSEVANNTADNFSSMNRDCFYQRPTEIAYINGYLIQQAKKYALPAPLNQTLYDSIQAITGDKPAH